MEGLTVVQARELQRVTRELWVLLDQDQYNEIMQIFKDAVDKEIKHQREAGIEFAKEQCEIFPEDSYMGEYLRETIKMLQAEPCEDAVSRTNLLKKFEDRFIELQKAHQKEKQLGVNWCINILKELPPVTPTQRWIHVSEEYPNIEDEYKYFLVTDEKGKVSVQQFLLSLDEEPQPYFSGMVNVIAWMPLPEPMKVGEK